MRPSEVSLDKLQLGDVSQNGRGGKTASLSMTGKPLRLTLRNSTTPFEVSSYDRVSDRKSLDFRADDETIAFVNRLDTELKKYAGKGRLQRERLDLAVETTEGGLCTAAPPEDFDHARGEMSLRIL